MKRTKTNKVEQPKRPLAILTGDWHIREDVPICRTDDFWETQWKKVDFISELQKKYDCPVLHSGDVFNHWKPSPYLLTKAIKHFPKQFHTVYGNHDLPQHSIEQIKKCGVYTLRTANELIVIPEGTWGTTPKKGQPYLEFDHRKILIWHVMTYVGKSPWPGCTDLTAMQILDKHPQYDLILTGHNHKSFVYVTGTPQKPRLLVNPGSLTRQDADQDNHEPRVYLWWAETNTVKQVLLPFHKNVISREHIDVPQERKERMKAYIERMNLEWKAGLSFKDNLEIHFKENRTPKQIKERIWTSME